MPKETQLIAAVGGGCCAIVLVVCLAVIPQIYWDIRRLNDEVINGVQFFRDETNAAWDQLMHVQLMGMASSAASTAAPAHPFTSLVDRLRRQTDQYVGLPSWCQCHPVKPQCPPGPPGPPGEPGQDGQSGQIGTPGEDNTQMHSQIQCPGPTDTACIKCPAGPQGPLGAEGPRGKEGQMGKAGEPGKSGQNGARGERGEAGEVGPKGQPGKEGTPGERGKDGTKVKQQRRGGGGLISECLGENDWTESGRATENGTLKAMPGQPGPKGRPGPPGKKGAPGMKGRNGEQGAPGAQGPPGKPGQPGQNGQPGKAGPKGVPGLPGTDAAYCPCPKRSAVYVNRFT